MARTTTAKPTAAPMAQRVVDLPSLCIRANVNGINAENRTVDLIFSTGAAVERMDWWTGKRYLEKLSMKPDHVRLERLNAGAPLLDAHSSWSISDQIGVVEDGTAVIRSGEGRATVRFSKRDAVDPIWGDVRDGIIRNVSIGYRVHKFEEDTGKGNDLPVRTAIDWEPYEISMVPMPADAGARVRDGDKSGTNQCVIVTRTGDHMRRSATTPPAADDLPAETLAERNPLEQDPPPAGDPPPAEEPNERDAGAAVERARCEGILNACRNGRMPSTMAAEMIRDSVSLVDAQARVLSELARRDGTAGPRPGAGPAAQITVGDDPLVHVRAGIENALLHRIAPDRFKLDDQGRQYRGMTLLSIGQAFLHSRGIRTSGLDRSRMLDMLLSRAGLHTTTDFPGLFEDAANKTLRAAYEAAPQTWLPISRTVNLTDFKPSRQLQVGDAPALLEILEHGEYTFGTIGEAKETIQLKTYGRMFGITRQALINDDLNAFGEVPAAFGRKARDIESDLAWAQITSNPNMGDGVALFNAASHFNFTSSGTVIDITALGVGRAALRNQKGIDAATLLNLRAQFLIVPAAKETIGDQVVSQIQPALFGSVNPFGANGRTPLTLIVEPRLDVNSAVSWYMATDVAQAPVLYHGVLDGQDGPLVTQMEGFDVDGMKFRCRIDVAFKAADWRAIYKNAGA